MVKNNLKKNLEIAKLKNLHQSKKCGHHSLTWAPGTTKSCNDESLSNLE